MNISKKIWFGLFICLGLILFSKQSIGRVNSEYSIIGNITNLPDGIIFYLIKYKGRYSSDTIMRTQSKHGRFVFNGRLLLEGELHFVKMDTSVVKLPKGKNSWVRLMLDHSFIELKGTMEVWPKVEISGSNATEDLEEYLVDSQQNEACYKARLKDPSIDSAQRGNYDLEFKKVVMDYFKKYYNSYCSIFSLLNSSLFDLKEKKSLFYSLAPKIRNSFYGAKLKKELDLPMELEKKAKENEAFLQSNSKRFGVFQIASGLQYEVINKGSGKIPLVDDNVKINYTAAFINGKMFESSSDMGGPAKFSLKRIIKGWTEALLLMPVGSKWRIYVPASLGYGDRPRPKIPARSVLIFEIELLEIVK